MLINYCDICKRNVGNNQLKIIRGFGKEKADFCYEICTKCYEKYRGVLEKDEKKFKTESQRYVDHKGYGEWSKVVE